MFAPEEMDLDGTRVLVGWNDPSACRGGDASLMGQGASLFLGGEMHVLGAWVLRAVFHVKRPLTPESWGRARNGSSSVCPPCGAGQHVACCKGEAATGNQGLIPEGRCFT